MIQLCLSRQYFPLRVFSVCRASPEAEARIIQAGRGASREKCGLFFLHLAGPPACGCAGVQRPALGGETFSINQ